MTDYREGLVEKLPTKPLKRMTEDELRKVLNGRITRSKNYIQETIGTQRRVAYDMYYGRPLGDEVEGRSQVVSRDVAQCIDSALPALIKIFAGSEKVVEFTPRGAEDVKSAEQATDLGNYVFWSQNNGYLLLHDCIFDGLLVKTGAFKWYWEDDPQFKEETYQGVTQGELMMLSQDPNVEIVNGNARPDGFYDVTVSKKTQSGQVRICVIPPEELGVDPDSTYEEPDFICHMPMKTLSQLIEMGYDRDLILSQPADDEQQSVGEDRINRDIRTQALRQDDEDDDPSQKKYRYYECYAKVDFDGDGVAELRRICMVGEAVLHNEATDHVPIAYWCPKVMPHEPIGMSMADDVSDQQILATVLWRQSLDNLYLSNSPRFGVLDGEVNIDDLLQTGPGTTVRMKRPDALFPIETPFVAQHTFQMLEWVKQETEARTGVSRYFQGLDPNSLNKTATGVTALMNAASARIELYARNFAEMAFKPLFRGIMYLLAKHQQQPLAARIRNKVETIDPRVWTTEYDMSVSVGLGTGTKDQQMMHLSNIIGLQMQLAQSPYAALVPPKQIYNAAAKLTEVSGFRDTGQFWRDPAEPPKTDPQTGQPTEPPWPPPPQPPPELQKAQMQIQADKERAGAEMQMKGQEMQQSAQLETQKAQAQISIEREKAQAQMQLEQFKAQQQAELEVFKAQLDAKVKLQTAEMQTKAQIGTTKLTLGMHDDMGPHPVAVELANVAKNIAEAAGKLGRPKKIKRGANGRAEGIE